jgi:TolB protein
MRTTQSRQQAKGVAVIALLGLLSAVGMGATTPPALATFPGHNGLIFFHSNRVTNTNPTGDYEIFSMHPNGSHVRQLTNNTDDDLDPSVSANGSTVSFVRNVPGVGGQLELFVMDADGSGQTQVTHNTHSEFVPSISPDGTHIAFQRDGQIYTIAVDGSGETQLTTDGTNDNPAWSPDGTQVAFDRDPPPSPLNNHFIFTIDTQGGQLTRRTVINQDMAYEEFTPSWSSDGSQLAFVGRIHQNEIFVVSLAAPRDNVPTQLTFNTDDDRDPAWSPDGKRIVWARTPASNHELFVMHADGSGQRRLTHTSEDDGGPDWQAHP